jgi:hypothetical protein
MSHTLAEAATAPSGFAESLIARLATGLDSADREPFRLAAETALAAMAPCDAGGRRGLPHGRAGLAQVFPPEVMRRDGMGRQSAQTGLQAHRRRQATLLTRR